MPLVLAILVFLVAGEMALRSLQKVDSERYDAMGGHISLYLVLPWKIEVLGYFLAFSYLPLLSKFSAVGRVASVLASMAYWYGLAYCFHELWGLL